MESIKRFADKVCCPYHPEAYLIEDYRCGDQICADCGLVVGDRVIDVSSEWRTFSNENTNGNPSRVGGPLNPLLNGSDLSTIIEVGNQASSFNTYGGSQYHNHRSMTSS
ncbi:hypothetical protein Pmani_010003 [Petrolisthes manimaculis]|uniref:TFIIB-type domain-containing protein n=1 Tax=Petrolisthes manimaculis TaxID=1843537 RepID=A0AAE1UHS7_9EUCA|nr:hypothetical protein Pmani_010003 [Petrolisthes manimaculis]